MRQSAARLTMFRLTMYSVVAVVLFSGSAFYIERLARPECSGDTVDTCTGGAATGSAIIWPVLVVILVMPVVVFFGEVIARSRRASEH